VREKRGGRGIKYGIVGIEYGTEITRVWEKWIYSIRPRKSVVLGFSDIVFDCSSYSKILCKL
jgi:hypothetical protein